MTQDEFKAKYNGGDKRTAKEKNLECDCYLPDSDKLKPEIIAMFKEITLGVLKEIQEREPPKESTGWL